MDYNTKKRSVWVIKVVNGLSTTYLPAVSVDTNRILTSCSADVVTDKCTMFGRRLHENGFSHELETVHVRFNWGLRMLRCKNPLSGEFVKISEDETLDYLDDVSHIGHPPGLVGASFRSYASYPCIKVDPLSFTEDDRVCGDHSVSMYDRVAPPYRKMGDFVNVGGGDVANTEFNRQLHPLLPVIQCAMLVETGNFGGPVYRENGDLIGILTHSHGSYGVAVHVSVIKAFVAEAAAKSNRETVGADGSEASTSRET